MHALAYPLFGLALGIVLSSRLSYVPEWLLFGGMGLALVLAFLTSFGRFKANKMYFVFIFLMIGASRHQLYNKEVQASIVEDTIKCSAQVVHELGASNKYRKYLVKTEGTLSAAGSWNNKGEKLLLYVPKKVKPLVRTEHVLISGNALPVPRAKNPHQFDYSRYMALKRVYTQVFVQKLVVKKEQDVLLPFFRWKRSLSEKIATHYNEAVALFTQVLILSDRSAYGPDDRERFSKAGVSHLFAISGLHTVIVFGLFWFLLFPLERWGYKRLRMLLALLGIWLFAVFVGLQPSVIRACFMLSLFTLSRSFARPLNLNDTLIVSAFFLLIINPNWLFDVGFQLSYAAVFFIGAIMSFITPLLRKRNVGIRYLGQLLGAGFAAQTGTAPLGIFYFHQFSLWGLFTNLLLIPFVSMILLLCLLVVMSIIMNFTPELWVQGVNAFFSYVELLISNVSKWQPEYFNRLFWTPAQVFFAYAFLLLFIASIRLKKLPWLYLSIMMIMGFQVFRWIDIGQKKSKKEIVFFSDNRQSLIGYRQGNHLQVHYNSEDDLENAVKYIIKPYAIGERIKNIDYQLMPAQKGRLQMGNQIIGINSDQGTLVYKHQYREQEVFHPQNKTRIDLQKEGAVIFDLKSDQFK